MERLEVNDRQIMHVKFSDERLEVSEWSRER